jgi:carbon-monoxide dehydrogenase large subunit
VANILGQRITRREDARFLRGEGTYVENLQLPGALHATFVRSPIAHARITEIDTSAAAALPGVQVFTAGDLGLQAMHPPPFVEVDAAVWQPFVASDTVRFAGEIAAVVVAESRAAAADAAELVLVDYEPLPAVADMQAALADEVVLFPSLGTNVCSRMGPEEPDETLFEGCEVVVSGALVSQRMAPCPLEPRSTAAVVGEDGRLSVWLSTQMPHLDRFALAGTLGLDPGQVRVVGPDVGGGFGAKGIGVEDILIAKLAQLTERPVRWTETRSESMVALRHGRAQILSFSLGGSRDGEIRAYRLDVVQDIGAYAFLGTFLPALTGLMASGVYRIPRIEYTARAVVTNTTTVGPFRGAGRPEATQAIERAMDLYAAEVGLDPAELRRRNFVPKDAFPYTTPSHATYDSGDFEGSLDLALERAGYEELRAEQQRRRDSGAVRQLGIGLSAYVEVTNGAVESEFGAVEITGDGKAILRTGSFSHGQGHETTFAMIAAERLGLPLEDVSVLKGDTDLVPQGGGTYASKSTQLGGSAARGAADAVVERGRELTAELLEANPGDVVLDPDRGRFHVAGTPTPGFSWSELAARLQDDGRLEELRAELDFKAEAATYPFGAHVAVVELDTETGEVELLRHIAVDDAGELINPLVAEGQVQGGVATGVAQALYEEVLYDDDANPLTANLIGYAFPSAAELPSFEIVEMVTPTPHNPLGAKGIGESGTIGSTPAVHNAVVDALAPFGVRHVDMPANGERVWRALQEAKAANR